MVKILEDAGSASVVELRVAWARIFGWRRVGADIEIAFEDTIDSLVDKGMIEGPDPLRLVGTAPQDV